MKSFFLALLVAFAFSEVFIHEKFGQGWENRWVQAKRDGLGKFVATTGEFSGDSNDKGIKTSEDARFYAFSTSHKSFSNSGKDLVVQFSVKFEQGIDCGGGYLKLLPKFDQEKFEGSTKYNMMFGPDICGSTRKVHLIFNYNGKNLDWKKSLTCESDKLSHLYQVVVHPDKTYEVSIDGVKKESGNLLEDWDFLPPKTIPDPNAKKPEDWVDQKEMVDPEDKKPEDWDKPKTIPDPNAKKPEDWNDEEDGKWEPAQLPNPEYRGEWTPKMIPNPAYKGEWVAPTIPNPDFKEDDSFGKYDDFSVVGLDLWQVKSGTVFDDIFIGNDVSEAKAVEESLLAKHKLEKEQHDKAEEEKRKKEEEERKKQEEAEKNKQTEKKDEKKDEEDLEKLAKEKAEQLKKEASTTEKKDEL